MLSLALLFSFLSVPVCAGRNTKVNVQSEDALVFDILDSGKWDKVASVSSFKNTDEGISHSIPRPQRKENIHDVFTYLLQGSFL